MKASTFGTVAWWHNGRASNLRVASSIPGWGATAKRLWASRSHPIAPTPTVFVTSLLVYGVVKLGTFTFTVFQSDYNISGEIRKNSLRSFVLLTEDYRPTCCPNRLKSSKTVTTVYLQFAERLAKRNLGADGLSVWLKIYRCQRKRMTLIDRRLSARTPDQN